jgi:hypothetical protein
MIPFPNQSAFPQGNRCIVANGTVEEGVEIDQGVKVCVERMQKRRQAGGEFVLKARKLLQGLFDSAHIAGIAMAQDKTTAKALDIIHRIEQCSDFFSDIGFVQQFFDTARRA